MSNTTTHNVSKKIHQQNAPQVATVLKTWQVINNTDTSIVIMDAFLRDPASADELYQRSLQLLSTTDSQQSINAGDTKTISLGQAHTDADGNDVDFTIIIARADNLFPVKVVELPVNGNTIDTITVSDAQLMKLAETFQQSIIAFPSSDMAKAFADALANADEQQIEAFFKSYPQYAAISLDMVTAIQTYYNWYGFVWAGYSKSKTYTLTTSDGTTKRSMGSLSISNQAVTPVTNLDSPVGFTVTYTDVHHKNTMLYYSGGQFSNDVNSSSPTICLQGLFILKSQLTGQDADDMITPVLYGDINDTNVFGYTNSDMSVSDTSGKSGIAALLDPQGISGWLKLCGLIAGIIAGIVVLAVTARYIIKARKKGPAPSPEEIRRAARQKAQDALRRMDPKLRSGLRIPDDLNVAIGDVKRTANENLVIDNRYKMQDIFQKQHDMCQSLLEYGNTSSLQKVLSNTINDAEVVVDGSPAEVAKQMKTLTDHVTSNNKLLSDRVSALGKKISKADADTISESKKVADDLTEVVLKNEKIREDLSEDEIPELMEE